MKEIITELNRGLPNTIVIERISSSAVRILFDTSTFLFVEGSKIQKIVATTGHGKYATADIAYCSRGIITITFNIVYDNDQGADIYKTVIKETLDYILTCK